MNPIRLILPIIVVISVAFCATAWMSYRNSRLILTNAIHENQAMLAEEISHTVSHAIIRLKETAGTVSSLAMVAKILRNDGAVNSQNEKLLQGVLDRLVQETGAVSGISLYTAHGQIVARSEGTAPNTLRDPDLIHARQNVPLLDTFKTFHSNDFSLFFVTPVNDKGEFLGVVRVEIDWRVLKQRWEDLAPADKGYRIRVASDDGTIVSCSYQIAEGSKIQNTPAYKVFSSPPMTLVPFMDEGIERVGMYMPIGETGMKVVIGVNKSVAYNGLDTLFKDFALMNGVAALAITVVMAVMLLKLIRVIRNLEASRSDALMEANRELEDRIAKRTSSLREQHARLKAQHGSLLNILETSPISITISGEDDRVLYANPAAQHLFNDEHGVLRPENLYQNIGDRKRVADLLNERGSVSNIPINMYSGGGVPLSMLLSAVKVQYDGRPSNLRWFADVTNIRAAQKALEKERTLLRTVFDAIPDRIYHKSPEGVYLACNKAFAALFGKQPDQVLGATDFQLLPAAPDRARTLIEADQIALMADGPTRGDETLGGFDGSVLQVETIKTPCVGEDGTLLGILGICRDITDRKAMEEDLVCAREQAQAGSRAKGDFLANMSHEIRTPMNGIIGLIHLALQTPDVPERLRDYLLKIDFSAQSLLHIINDILDFSKIEAGHLEIEEIPFSLAAKLENIIQPLLPAISTKGIELVLDLAPDLPTTLVGDPTRIGQVLTNLIGNAAKFTHQGGIILGVHANSIDDKRVELQFSVSDTGIGMDASYQKRLFDSFSQADTSITRRYGGTGLGLSICKSLIELMGGSISVKSAPGKGATFAFSLICALQQDTVQPHAPGSLDDMNILLVNDNEVSLSMLTDYLKTFGARLQTETSGQQALEMFEQNLAEGTPYDVVILDWKMAGISGLELVRRIRDRASTKIMVTAYDWELSTEKARSLDIQTVLTKPVTRSSLYDALIGVHSVETIVEHLRHTAAKEAFAMPNDANAEQGEQSAPCATKPLFPLKGSRILLAEDNEINKFIMLELLRSYGCEVCVAHNGLEAVRYALEQPFDVILMDIQMPEMDGLQATERIRANAALNNVPIIAMTAHAMAGDEEKSLTVGMQAHLTKPVAPDALYAMLLRWISPKDALLPDVPLYTQPFDSPETA